MQVTSASVTIVSKPRLDSKYLFQANGSGGRDRVSVNPECLRQLAVVDFVLRAQGDEHEPAGGIDRECLYATVRALLGQQLGEAGKPRPAVRPVADA